MNWMDVAEVWQLLGAPAWVGMVWWVTREVSRVRAQLDGLEYRVERAVERASSRPPRTERQTPPERPGAR